MGLKYCALLCCLVWPFSAWTAESLTAYQVVAKSDEKMRGLSSYSEATLTIIRPDWQRAMGLKSWSKGREYDLVLITAPARDKGSASLKRGKEMWNWLPRIERVVKIAPSMLGQSWMGSDFTNDDLINQSSILVDYTHVLNGEEELPDGTRCWRVTATPKPDAPVVWGKLELWISQTHFNQRRVEFYDENLTLINRLSADEVRDLGGRQIPVRMVMQPADKPEQRTEMLLQQAEFDFAIEEDFFSLQRLRSVR